MLELQDVEVRYGRIRAVRGASLTVPDGSVFALLGANGAGKSSLLKALSGLVRPYAGAIRWDGRDISRLSPHRILRLGVCHVPEGRAMIATLTVRENLQMGAYVTRRAKVEELIEEMVTLFPSLERRLGTRAGSLSGGEQQMLAIARGLMSRPKLIAIDEPSMGLAPAVATDVLTGLKAVVQAGTSVLLVEQNAALALRIADTVAVIGHGEVRRIGPVDELRDDILSTYVQ
jgi:branched-chain amino acid transport system ATP-binding protein